MLRGNAVIMKCLIPSFVTEYVTVASWIISEADDETVIKIDDIVNNEGIYNNIKTNKSFFRSIATFNFLVELLVTSYSNVNPISFQWCLKLIPSI